jgi:hypothetical protein
VKLAEILRRLKTQFSDKTLLRNHVYDCTKSFKEGPTEVEHMRRLYLLQGKLWPAYFGDLKTSYSTIF